MIELSETIDNFFGCYKLCLSCKEAVSFEIGYGSGFSITCATKATKIWDVLNVATVDGGIIVNDLVVQKKPNKPIMKYKD